MKTKISTLARPAISLMVVAAALAVPRTAIEGSTGDGAAAARQSVAALMSAGAIPGMQVTVATGGRVVWSEAFGRADLELDVAMTRRHVMRIGSVSKPLTAFVLGRLVQKGTVDLDAPVRRYAPGVSEPAASSTLRQLGGHLAGIRNYKGDEFFSRRRFDAVGDAVAVFASDPLIAPPGERFAYSSYNFTVLSAAMEGAAATPFLTLVDQVALKPLGLIHVRPDQASAIIPGRVSQYERNRDGLVERAPFVDLSNKWAGGGFLANTDDLTALGIAYLDDDIMKPSTRSVLFTSQVTAGGAPSGYGIGWRVAKTADGATYLHHGGEAMGGRAFLLIVPATRSVVAIAANLGAAAFSEKDALQLLALFSAGTKGD